jgi:hypothetical protein
MHGKSNIKYRELLYSWEITSGLIILYTLNLGHVFVTEKKQHCEIFAHTGH